MAWHDMSMTNRASHHRQLISISMITTVQVLPLNYQ